MRKAKRDAGIPTSQTYRKRTKHNNVDGSNSKGIDYEFDGGKTIQHHPNGHPEKVKESHWNNHPHTHRHNTY